MINRYIWTCLQSQQGLQLLKNGQDGDHSRMQHVKRSVLWKGTSTLWHAWGKLLNIMKFMKFMNKLQFLLEMINDMIHFHLMISISIDSFSCKW